MWERQVWSQEEVKALKTQNCACFNHLVQKLCQATACGLEKHHGQILQQLVQFSLLQGRAQVSRWLERCYNELNQLLFKVTTVLKHIHIYVCIYIHIYISQHPSIHPKTLTNWIHILSFKKCSSKVSSVWSPGMRNLCLYGEKEKIKIEKERTKEYQFSSGFEIHKRHLICMVAKD